MPESLQHESWPPDLARVLLERGLIPEVDETLIEPAPGFTVRRSFLRSVPLNVDGSERLVVHIRVDPETGRPKVFGARHVWKHGVEFDDIPEERVRRIVEFVYAEEARSQAEKRMMGGASVGVADNIREDFPELPERLFAGAAVLDSAELARVEQRALRAVRPKPGPRPVESDRKLEALELFRQGGIPLAMEQTGKAERTLRRWIADARKLEREDG